MPRHRRTRHTRTPRPGPVTVRVDPTIARYARLAEQAADHEVQQAWRNKITERVEILRAAGHLEGSS